MPGASPRSSLTFLVFTRTRTNHSHFEVVVIRAMVWKEFREQGLIALTLLVLGSGILVAELLPHHRANHDDLEV